MKRLMALAAVAILSGCANIGGHLDPGVMTRYIHPYYGTVANVEAIKVAFVDPTGPEGLIAKSYAILLLPVLTVDLPLEVVADTVTAPYDTYKYIKRD